ncbi:MAG: tetratricopeptide repeat protein, partial [Myxococcota bacterium]
SQAGARPVPTASMAAARPVPNTSMAAGRAVPNVSQAAGQPVPTVSGSNLPPVVGAELPADPSAAPAVAVQAPPRPKPRPRRALTEEELGIAPKQPDKAGGLKTTVVLGLGGLAILGLVVGVLAAYRVRTEKLANLSKPAREAVSQDSLPSLRKGLKNFEEMLDISSDQPIAVAHIAYIKAIMFTQYGTTKEAEAEAAVAAAEKKAEDNATTHVARAMMLTKAGKAQEAVNLLEDIRTKLGDNAALEVALGEAYLALGNLEKAGDAFQSARNRGPKDARPVWATAELFRLIGRDRDAIGNFDAALRVDRDHAPSRIGRTLTRLETGTPSDVQAAQTDLNILADRPESLGENYGTLKDLASAEVMRLTGNADFKKVFDDVKKKLGNHPDVLVVQARIAMDEGKSSEAAKILKDVVAKNPGRLSAQIALVRALIDAGQYGEAETVVEKAQKALGKPNLDLAILVGVARREKKDLKGSEDAFKKANEIYRDHPRVQLELARTYTEEKKYADALTLLQSAVEGSADNRSLLVETFTQTAITLSAKGDDNLALVSLNEALKTDQNYAPAYYWRGMVLKNDKKQRDEARNSFQKYLDKAPRGELAQKATRERDALR